MNLPRGHNYLIPLALELRKLLLNYSPGLPPSHAVPYLICQPQMNVPSAQFYFYYVFPGVLTSSESPLCAVTSLTNFFLGLTSREPILMSAS